MPLAHYFIGSRLLGSKNLTNGADPLNSIAWFCEGCGDAWARVLVEGALWATEHNRCERCGPAGLHDNRVAGSLLRQWFFTANYLMGRNQAMALENLPLPVLEREFRLALVWAERQVN